MIAHPIAVNGTTQRKMKTGDTTQKTPKLMQNVLGANKDAAQTPIVAVLTVGPASVVGGEKENVLCLNHQSHAFTRHRS